MRSRTLALTTFLLAGVLLLGGCARKQKPKTGADAADSADVPVATTPAPSPAPAPAAPSPEAAPDHDPLAGDLDAVNVYLRSQGLLADAYFAYDRAELTAEARERLAGNARFLGEHRQFLLTVEGHCDERGTSEYNLALGERRAAAVRDYLVSLGVEQGRLSILSYGKERPVCQDQDESCWQQNRRGHPRVSGRH